jgi:uncharacterized protein (TIGR02301 family)
VKGTVVAAALAALATALTAHAQDRSPAERQTLVSLAYVLGESQALRQGCNGVSDVYWRSRMRELIEAEQPEAPFQRRLVDSFNQGFTEGQQRFPRCDAASRAEAARAAAKGRELAVTLSGSVADDEATR